MYIKLTQLIHGESEALQGFKSFVHSGKRLGINNTLVLLTTVFFFPQKQIMEVPSPLLGLYSFVALASTSNL